MKSLKDLIIRAQRGDEEAKNELFTEFLPLVHKMSRCRNPDINRADLEQDLWEYFWKCTFTFDSEKADHFGACMCKRLHFHVKYLLRRWWKKHRMEGQPLEGVKEKTYESRSETLALEDMERVLLAADCPPQVLKITLLLAKGMTQKDISRTLGTSPQAISKYKKKLKSLLEEHPEVMEYLKGDLDV